MAKIKFLKDCKWCIDNKGVDFKLDEVHEIEDQLASKMVAAEHAKYDTNIPTTSKSVTIEVSGELEIDNKVVAEEEVETKVVKKKRGRPRKVK